MISSITKKKWFKTISFLLIHAFLLLDIAWAGGTEILSSKNNDCLSPMVQIGNDSLQVYFNSAYDVPSSARTARMPGHYKYKNSILKKLIVFNQAKIASIGDSTKRYVNRIKYLVPVLLLLCALVYGFFHWDKLSPFGKKALSFFPVIIGIIPVVFLIIAEFVLEAGFYIRDYFKDLIDLFKYSQEDYFKSRAKLITDFPDPYHRSPFFSVTDDSTTSRCLRLKAIHNRQKKIEAIKIIEKLEPENAVRLFLHGIIRDRENEVVEQVIISLNKLGLDTELVVLACLANYRREAMVKILHKRDQVRFDELMKKFKTSKAEKSEQAKEKFKQHAQDQKLEIFCREIIPVMNNLDFSTIEKLRIIFTFSSSYAEILRILTGWMKKSLQDGFEFDTASLARLLSGAETRVDLVRILQYEEQRFGNNTKYVLDRSGRHLVSRVYFSDPDIVTAQVIDKTLTDSKKERQDLDFSYTLPQPWLNKITFTQELAVLHSI